MKGIAESEELLNMALDFQSESHKARTSARDQYRKNESSKDNTLRIYLDGFIVKLAMRMINNPTRFSDEKVSYQIGLSASFIRTYFLIGDLVMSGDYIEAAIIMRKQLESIARMIEIDMYPLKKLYKRTPNVSNILDKIGKQLYPYLSEIAHAGTPDVAELLSIQDIGELVGPSLYPTFNTYADKLYATNTLITISFIRWYIDKLKALYSDYDPYDDLLIFTKIVKLAVDLDIIKIMEP